MNQTRKPNCWTRHAFLVCSAAVALAGCDRDGDGVRNRLDCAPSEAAAYAGAAEICDNIDNDCDGIVDESDDGAGVWGFVDRDGDGRAGDRVFLCPRYLQSRSSEDCDEYNAAVFVGQREVCNGIDDDCDGFVDVDMTGLTLHWPDRDGDGYGDATQPPTCTGGDGLAARAGDCDDNDPDARPGSIERCDGIDNDCNGVIDDIAGGCP